MFWLLKYIYLRIIWWSSRMSKGISGIGWVSTSSGFLGWMEWRNHIYIKCIHHRKCIIHSLPSCVVNVLLLELDGLKDIFLCRSSTLWHFQPQLSWTDQRIIVVFPGKGNQIKTTMVKFSCSCGAWSRIHESMSAFLVKGPKIRQLMADPT